MDWLAGCPAKWRCILQNGGRMIHSSSLDYLIIIPSGAWDWLSCKWHITHHLFSSYCTSLKLFIPLSIPNFSEVTPQPQRGGGGCTAGPVRHGRPPLLSLLHLLPLPHPSAAACHSPRVWFNTSLSVNKFLSQPIKEALERSGLLLILHSSSPSLSRPSFSYYLSHSAAATSPSLAPSPSSPSSSSVTAHRLAFLIPR